MIRYLDDGKGPSQDQGEGPTSQPVERFAPGLVRGGTRPEEVGDAKRLSGSLLVERDASEDRGVEGLGFTPSTTLVGEGRRTSVRLARSDAEVFKRPSSRNSCFSISGSKFFNPSPGCLSSDEEGTLTDASVASSAGGLCETRKLFTKESRKRSRKSAGAEGSSSDAPSVKSTKSASSKRGRPRKPQPSTDHFVGLAEAQREANRLKREALAQELEAKVAAQERQANLARAKHGYGTSLWSDYSDKTVAELQSLHDADMGSIVEIARKSSNMKGTLQKALRDHAANAKNILASMATRSAPEEVQRLQATVNRLEEEKLQQHRRIEALEAKIAKLEGAAPLRQVEVESMDVASAMTITANPITASLRGVLEEMLLKHAAETKVFVRSCFAGIEDRLNPPKIVRPPLAAGNRKGLIAEPAPKTVKGKGIGKKTAPKVSEPSANSEVSASYASVASTAASSKRAIPEPPKVKSGPRKDSRPKATTSCPNVAVAGPLRHPAPGFLADTDGMLPATTAANEWQVAGNKGKKKKAKAPTATVHPSTSKTPTQTAKKKKGGKSVKAIKVPKLVPPKSAAVVLTITPEAVEQGVSYEKVLTKARESVKPREMGIEEVKCRQTQTGARLFEFSGACRDANADLFANALRVAVTGLAIVGRPTRSTSLVISELDDSVTRDEVVEVVAAVGGCSPEAIKAGELRPGRRGIGEIRLSCPVAAAEAVLKKGLSIGFSSGVVRALEDQPMRCFKCFSLGHTRARCPSPEDRSALCRRCGKADHKADACNGKPHCSVCAASSKAANHKMGGAKCKPPTKRGIAPAQTGPAKATTAEPVAGGSLQMEE